MQERFRKQVKSLLGRIGLTAGELKDDSCTIHVDAVAIHVVGRANRWAVLFCEIGALPQQPDAALLRRLLGGNLRPADGPPCVLAVEDGTQQVVLWCQVDFTACDDLEFFQLFERFIESAEQAQTWLQQGCQPTATLAAGAAGKPAGKPIGTPAQAGTLVDSPTSTPAARFAGPQFRPGGRRI